MADDNRNMKIDGAKNLPEHLQEEDSVTSILQYWKHIYGEPDESKTYLSVASGTRPPGENGKKNKGRYQDPGGNFGERYYSWPDEAEEAAQYALRASEEGHNVYSCAHLLVKKERKKETAASIVCLYADGDEAMVPEGIPDPTLTIESSPGRYQYYWRLNRRISSGEAENLNRRLTYKIGADKGCWNLTRILRIPGTKNYDYAEVYDEVPTVQVVV